MTTPIAPGDWVECITNMDAAVTRRTIYRVCKVVAVGRDCCGCAPGDCGKTGLRLSGVAHQRTQAIPDLLCSGGFRPIYRPKSSFIESLTQPVEDLVSTPTEEGVGA